MFVAHPVNAPQDHKITLKRVMDFVKDKGDENAKEINRKLQHMLEETLTKNMHLQKVNTRNNSKGGCSKTAPTPNCQF